MRLSARLAFVLLLVSASFAQQDPKQLSSQVDKLTALVEQQQKQIEQLQKSQAELLQEIRAQRAQSPATLAVTPTAADAPAPSPDSTPQQSPAYDARKERGISLGDRVRIGGYGSI